MTLFDEIFGNAPKGKYGVSVFNPEGALLSHFLVPKALPLVIDENYWGHMFRQPFSSTLLGFRQRGLIQYGDFRDQLEYLSLTDLQKICRNNKLPIYSDKTEAINGILSAPKQISEILTTVLVCTPAGREIAQPYVDTCITAWQKTLRLVSTELEASRFEVAIEIANEYCKTPLSGNSSDSDRKSKLAIIATANPAIFSGLSVEDFKMLRLAASMKLLCGETGLEDIYATTATWSHRLDTRTATQMLINYATNYLLKRNYAMPFIGLTGEVTIKAAIDCCEACRQQSNNQYPAMEAPELPHPNCTSIRGCTCIYKPVIKQEGWLDDLFNSNKKRR